MEDGMTHCGDRRRMQLKHKVFTQNFSTKFTKYENFSQNLPNILYLANVVVERMFVRRLNEHLGSLLDNN